MAPNPRSKGEGHCYDGCPLRDHSNRGGRAWSKEESLVLSQQELGLYHRKEWAAIILSGRKGAPNP